MSIDRKFSEIKELKALMTHKVNLIKILSKELLGKGGINIAETDFGVLSIEKGKSFLLRNATKRTKAGLFELSKIVKDINDKGIYFMKLSEGDLSEENMLELNLFSDYISYFVRLLELGAKQIIQLCFLG
jgi:hypothetical protein